MQICKQNHLITSMEEWFQHAPPQKGIKQWRNGRSAKELARAWFPDTVPMPLGNVKCVPVELRQLLKSSEVEDFEFQKAEPELESLFDDVGTMQANLDLSISGTWKGIKTVFGIEAKADEPFSKLIGDHYDDNPPSKSNIQKRINNLCNVFFGKSLDESPDVLRPLRYQLLTGTAGTIAEAGRCKAQQAVFNIHVFYSKFLNSDNVNRNNQDYRKFLALLGERAGFTLPETDITGRMFGPMTVHTPTQYIPKIPFYIGLCSRNIDPLLDLIGCWERAP